MAEFRCLIDEMKLRYHPMLAFLAFYLIGLFTLLVSVALLGKLENPAVIWLITSGYINAVPLLIVWFSAHRSALANGKPLFSYVGHDPKAVRAQFRKHILLFAIAFGLSAAVADLSSVALSFAAGLVEGFHYPMSRLLLLAGVYGAVAYFGIKDSFRHPMPLVPQAAETSDTSARPIPIKASERFFDR